MSINLSLSIHSIKMQLDRLLDYIRSRLLNDGNIVQISRSY